MPFYMYQGAYTPQSWAAQVKNPPKIASKRSAAKRARRSEAKW